MSPTFSILTQRQSLWCAVLLFLIAASLTFFMFSSHSASSKFILLIFGGAVTLLLFNFIRLILSEYPIPMLPVFSRQNNTRNNLRIQIFCGLLVPFAALATLLFDVLQLVGCFAIHMVNDCFPRIGLFFSKIYRFQFTMFALRFLSRADPALYDDEVVDHCLKHIRSAYQCSLLQFAFGFNWARLFIGKLLNCVDLVSSFSRINQSSGLITRHQIRIFKCLISLFLALLANGVISTLIGFLAFILFFESLHIMVIVLALVFVGRTRILSACSEKLVGTREYFQKMEVDLPPLASNHGHPFCAQVRGASISFAADLAHASGRELFSISRSTRDARNGVSGTRQFFVAKDLAMEHCDDPVHNNQLVQMIDVDYYPNMNEILQGFRKVCEVNTLFYYFPILRTAPQPVPILLHSFAPASVFGNAKDYCWFTRGNEITMEVAGGSPYNHELWDYSGDTLTAWVNGTLIHYNVDSKRYEIDPNFSLINISPTRQYHLQWVPFYLCFLFTKVGDSNLERPLKRVQTLTTARTISLTGKSYVARRSLREHKGQIVHYLSVALCGTATGFYLPEFIIQTLALRSAQHKLNKIGTGLLNVSDVERLVEKEMPDDRPLFSKSTYPLVVDYVEHAMYESQQCFIPGPLVKHNSTQFMFDVVGPLVFGTATPSMRSICEPLGGQALAPARSYNNDVATINGRITKVGQKSPMVRIPHRWKTTRVHQFRKLFLKDNFATLVPDNYDDVVNEQTRPTQVANQRRSYSFMDIYHRMVSSFMKSEAYLEPKTPRNISTVTQQHLVSLSSFTYPFSKIMKSATWYAFGRDPEHISQAIVQLCEKRLSIESGDISRLDGSYCWELGQVVAYLFLAAFKPEYREELLKLLDAETNCPGYTKFGVRYDTGATTLSGSPFTSIRNSLGMAFIIFCILCDMKGGSDDDAMWAFENIGLVGGDDTLCATATAEQLTDGFAKWNLKYKPNTIPRDEPVVFLGRYFLNPWCGDKSCIADVNRLMSRMHLTANKLSSPTLILAQKAFSYLVTDPNTPLVSHWSKKLLSLISSEDCLAACSVENVDEGFWAKSARLERKSFVPPDYDCVGVVASNLGLTVAETQVVIHQIESSETLGQLLSLKGFWGQYNPVEPEQSIILNGDIIPGPPPVPNVKLTLAQPPSTSALIVELCGDALLPPPSPNTSFAALRVKAKKTASFGQTVKSKDPK